MRFPNTAALLEQEGLDVLKALIAEPAVKATIEAILKELYMASVKELTDALNSAKASVDTLVGKVGQTGGGIDPSDLDPVLKEITDLRSTVEAMSASLPGKQEATDQGASGSTAGTAAQLGGVGAAGAEVGQGQTATGVSGV
jgi:hypothetical protein